MPDSDPTAPPAGGDPPNYIARSALGVLRRTERALSPWGQRIWQASQPPAIQRRAAGSAGESTPAPIAQPSAGPFRFLNRPAGLTNQSTQTIINRVQRAADQASVMQSKPAARTGAAMERMGTVVAGRFPDVSRKYMPQAEAEPGTVQRSELPFSGGAAGASAPEMSAAMPDVSASMPDFSAVSALPNQSLTAQLTARLQALRDPSSSSPQTAIQSASPRQISRKAADLTAARTTKSERPMVRRGQVEEIGSTPDAAPRRPTAPPTIQRKAADAAKSTATAKPTPRPAAPDQPAWMSNPDPFQMDPKPGLPSVTQQLVQRTMAQRTPANVQRKGPEDEQEALPSWLRKDSPAKAAPAPSAPTTPASPAPIQRSPEIQRKPEAPRPAQVEPPLSPKRPTIQRRVADSAPAAPQPDSMDSPTPHAPEPAEPAQPRRAALVQRKTDPTTEPAEPAPKQADAQPLAVRPTVQRSSTPAPAPASEPASDLTLQRKTAPQKPAVEPTPSEAVQAPRPVEPQPKPPTLQRQAVEPAEPPVGQPPTPVRPTVQRKIAPAPSELPLSTSQPPSPKPASPPSTGPVIPPVSQANVVQRQASDLPLRTQPPSSSSEPPEAPAEAPTMALGRAVSARTQSSANLPLSRPPSVQRQTADRAAAVSAPAQPLAIAPVLAAPSRSGVVQRQPARITSTTGLLRARMAEPLALPHVTAAPASVQRMTESPPAAQPALPRPKLPLTAPVSRTMPKVQREITTPESRGEGDASSGEQSGGSSESRPDTAGPDLNALARQIYPILRRMLALERERRQ